MVANTLPPWLVIVIAAFSLASNTTENPEGTAELQAQADEGVPTPQADALFFNPSFPNTESGGLLESAARAVSQLVSANFSPPKRPSPAPNFFVGSLMRLLGFDTSKLSAIAVNALIFIAQLLGSSLSSKAWDEKLRDDISPPGTPLGWIFDNSPVEARKLVHAAEDSSLPDQLIDIVRFGTSETTDCIELLICNAAPVIWSMQRYLYKPPDPTWSSMTPLQRMFAYLPSFKQLLHNSEGCEVQFPDCKDRNVRRKR